MRATQIAGEKPVGSPLAEPAQRRQPSLDLVVGEERQRGQVEVGAREPDRVLGLAPREAEREELLLRGGREPLPGRERPDPAHLLAEPLDEPVADGDGRIERDLLCRDRADEHLERIGREGRPEAGEPDDEGGQELLSAAQAEKATRSNSKPSTLLASASVSASSGSTSTP